MDDRPPLFVPLRAEYFRAFAAGKKRVEWRKFGPRYNERTLYPGRQVTLSNGYSGERLHGVIVALEFRPARKVPGALDIYQPADVLVGFHIKLARRRARPR